MTNVEGLWMLFVALGLFVVSLGVTGLLAVIHWRQRGGTAERAGRVSRVTTWLAVVGIGVSILSWLYALVFVTPAGILDRLATANPVLLGLLVGYTVPGVLGAYVLRAIRRRTADRRAA